MKLWLDDVREPWAFGRCGWTWAKTAQEAIDWLKTGHVEMASFDHDLTPEQTLGGIYGEIREDGCMSGYDVLCWLEQNPQYWPLMGIKVHSQNAAGRKRMEQVIEKMETRRRQ